MLLVNRHAGHSNRQQNEADHRQVTKDAYSATGIGRGRSCSPVLEGRRRIPTLEATTSSRRPISGGCIGRDEGRQGRLTLGGDL